MPTGHCLSCREFVPWYLPLVLICLSVSCVSTNDEEDSPAKELCKEYENATFYIRAMTYTDRFFYLVNSLGELYVQETHIFIYKIKIKESPTIYLDKPIANLSSCSAWKRSHSVLFTDPMLQFCFNHTKPEPIFEMIKFKTKKDKSKLKICVHQGFQMQWEKAPSQMSTSHVCAYNQEDKTPPEKPAFWLIYKNLTFPVHTKVKNRKTVFRIDEEFLSW